MAEKKSNREKLNEITASIEQGIKELFQSDKYAEYLRTMSRFHSYSARNTILIHMQRPDATVVAGFNAWKNKFQRHVKKGEKGITILAPTPYKKKIEEKKLDPVTKSPMLDHDGNVIMKEKEVEIPLFRPVKVFDVSQTEGKPLPHLSSPLTGDVQNYEIVMEALRRTSPVPIAIKPIQEEGVNGFLDLDARAITVKEGMGQMQTVRTTIHEIAHAVLHLRERDRLSAIAGTEQETKPKDRNTKEVEAESVSFSVCQYFGLQTGDYSFGYIAAWSKDKSLPELKASLETIGKTANQLITDIDRHFKAICKERGIDLAQPEQSVPEAPAGPLEDVSPEEPFVEPPSDVLPEPSEQADTSLDEYPMPDPNIFPDTLEVNCGYTDGDLLPLSKDRAAELLERDLTVYAVQTGENPVMVFDTEELAEQPEGMVFAVSKEEWEASPDFHQLIVERMDHQEERERAFLAHGGDCFAIYQLRHDDSTRDLVYEPLERIRQAGESPRKGNYELAYTGKLVAGQDLGVLDKLWEQFNINHPADYHRPSMSISDIIAVKQDGVVSCHYVDRLGFSALPGFFQSENYLKNAELLLEDDMGMIDGIINNAPKVTVAELEGLEKKQSVREKLKNQPKPEQKRTAPRRSAERDR